jgi:hypothetical protein
MLRQKVRKAKNAETVGARESGRCQVARGEYAEGQCRWVSEKARDVEAMGGWVVGRRL